jgi:hypothetical protein
MSHCRWLFNRSGSGGGSFSAAHLSPSVTRSHALRPHFCLCRACARWWRCSSSCSSPFGSQPGERHDGMAINRLLRALLMLAAAPHCKHTATWQAGSCHRTSTVAFLSHSAVALCTLHLATAMLQSCLDTQPTCLGAAVCNKRHCPVCMHVCANPAKGVQRSVHGRQSSGEKVGS